jgi:TRAP-type C4-dicarboxylate transport system permease small subunit
MPVTKLVERLLGFLVAVLLFAMMVVTVIDVIGRYSFNSPLPGAVEINELLLSVVVFGAFPLVTLRREHVTITLLEGFFQGFADRVRRLILVLLSCIVVAAITWRIWEKAVVLASYDDRTNYLGVPLAPFAFFMSGASGLTTVVLIGLLFSQLRELAASRRQGNDLD